MENDVLSTLAIMDGYRRNDQPMYGHCGRSHNTATTGIGLAAGLGGGALLLGIAGLWGVNQASKARQEGNKSTIDALSQNVQNLTQFAFMEHTNRTNWQNLQVPTVSNILDIRSGALANATSNAYSQAEAQIVADALSGRSEICPQRVSLYSAPAPCQCPAPAPQCGCGM